MQSQIVLKEIEHTTELRSRTRNEGSGELRFLTDHLQHGSLYLTKLAYLAAHLESLRLTLSVLLQTLYTAQSIMWSK